MIEPLVVELREDTDRSLDAIRLEIEGEIGRSLSPSQFRDDFALEVSKLRGSFEALRRTIYSDLRIESADPHYSYLHDVFNPGGWLGVYRFDIENVGTPVHIKINPKISPQSFSLMVNEITELVPVLGNPAMDVACKNVYGDNSLTKLVTYSNLMRELTEMTLREGLPRTVLEQEFTARELLGIPDLPRTVQLARSGIPLVASRRLKVSFADLPRMLVARFHLRLLTGLEQVRKSLGRENQNWLAEPFHQLENYHRFILEEPEFSDVLGGAISGDFESQEVLEEARRLSGRNESLGYIINAYELFLEDLRWGELALQPTQDQLPLQPVPASKVYELWVLKLMVDSVGQLTHSKHPRAAMTEVNRSGLQAAFGPVELCYNYPMEKWSKILRQLGLTPRPDFIINPGRGMAAVDAKYKTFWKLTSSDMERLLAYLLDFSEPQRPSEIKAFVVLLEQTESWAAFERDDINPPARVFTLEATPERPREARENVTWMCEKVLRQEGVRLSWSG